MKTLNKTSVYVGVLSALLALSVVFNLLQGLRIDALTRRVRSLLEIQSLLGRQIDELETAGCYDSYPSPEEPEGRAAE